MQSPFAVLALLASVAVAHTHHFSAVPNTFPDISACLSQPSVYSCENTTRIENTCCSPTPGGLVLATQFWSTYTGLEKEGQLLPKGSWTIHGLWPDNCDGSYQQYCDPTRQYDPAPGVAGVANYTGPGVDTFILEFGRQDLLDYMNKYWINQGAPNKNFWAHEFSKHATCTSTFDVACYGPSYKKHQDVVNFYDAVIRAWSQYPTFDMLASFGIVPSNKTTYSLGQIQSVLQSQTGAVPYLGCVNNGTALSEVWYFSHVYGTEQYGTYKTLNSTTPSTCSETEPIWYYERTATSEHEVNN
ncbi:ribonuclease T2-like protein [Mycena maculata]|uniref:ribonuclease T2 n=1 Tax=Mycena maculata TaxID=230809 RepID=A0AAD7IYU7_9AGAR|nr:ribonuclease T2-like protein [Mycena maculata]